MATLRFKKPMLAKEFAGHQDKIEYPCYVQPKLDGIRCITDGQRFWSRNGKLFHPFNMMHLRKQPLPFLVDGELMVRDGGDFEDLSSIVKRNRHQACEDLEFNVFDIMTKDVFVERWLRIEKLFRRLNSSGGQDAWVMVPTMVIDDEEQLQRRHKWHLKCGREGTMVRSAEGLYVPKRTTDLLKYKPLKSAEFRIVRVKEARGKDKGTPVYICTTTYGGKDAHEFRARPMGTIAQRRKMWRRRGRDIGKMLTVEFQNLTKYGVPRFPRAKVLRDYE